MVAVEVVQTALAKIARTNSEETNMATSNKPAQPVGSMDHIPEFISNLPDPATGIPVEDGDGDIHDNIYSNSVQAGHYGAATFDGDMGRLSRVVGQ